MNKFLDNQSPVENLLQTVDKDDLADSFICSNVLYSLFLFLSIGFVKKFFTLDTKGLCMLYLQS